MNLFDNIPDQEPVEITAGTLWQWTKSDISSTYPTGLYTLRYTLHLKSASPSRYEFAALKTDAVHTVGVPTATTASYASGDYTLQATIIRDSDSESIVLYELPLTIRPILKASGADSRSHAERVLDSINATIEKTATKEQASYSIAGRSLARRTIDELLSLKDYYERIVLDEKLKMDRKNGKRSPRVLVKMGA